MSRALRTRLCTRSFISQGRTRIDVHHHVFPASIGKAGLSAKVGWLTPPENLPWTPEISLKAMNQLGVRTAVLSLPAGLPAGPAGDANRAAAREFNEYATQICDEHPGRFGFFACLPDLFDTKGACSGALLCNDTHGSMMQACCQRSSIASAFCRVGASPCRLRMARVRVLVGRPAFVALHHR